MAVQAPYFSFDTKEALLQEITNREVLGDDEVPPHRSVWAVAAHAEPDPRLAVAMIVEAVAAITRRVAPLIPVFRSVTGDAADEMYQRSEERRRRGYRVPMDDLVQKPLCDRV